MNYPRILKYTAIVGIGSLVLAYLAGLAGARINTTRSIPVGLYWAVDAPITKGAYVAVCPPQEPVFFVALRRGYIPPGDCPGGFGLLMKHVLAAKNDTISIDSNGVRINGRLLPKSTPLATDAKGRPLQVFKVEERELESRELLLMTDINPSSFDARYFGPLNKNRVKDVIRPIFTWGGSL